MSTNTTTFYEDIRKTHSKFLIAGRGKNPFVFSCILFRAKIPPTVLFFILSCERPLASQQSGVCVFVFPFPYGNNESLFFLTVTVLVFGRPSRI